MPAANRQVCDARLHLGSAPCRHALHKCALCLALRAGAVTGSTKEPPLVAFRFTRSFAGEEVGEGAGTQDGSQAGSPSAAAGASTSGAAAGGHARAGEGAQAAAGAVTAAGGAALAAAAGQAAVEKVQSIKSFKDIRLDVGEGRGLLICPMGCGLLVGWTGCGVGGSGLETLQS